MDYKSVGKIIRFHRKQADLSREGLAKVAGVGKTVVFDVENGKLSVRFETLVKLLKALNIRLYFESPLMEQFSENS